jgi:hypothetical protein
MDCGNCSFDGFLWRVNSWGGGGVIPGLDGDPPSGTTLGNIRDADVSCSAGLIATGKIGFERVLVRFGVDGETTEVLRDV